MSARRIQVFDGRRQVIVRPEEIEPGDWLRDLGTLRRVVEVEDSPAAGGIRRFFRVRFEPVVGVEERALSIPSTETVTVWRPT